MATPNESKPIQRENQEETKALSEEINALPSGVNPEFYDSPEIQTGWMNHAKKVLNNNLPAGADNSKVKDLYFHRGFKGWAVSCGKVQLLNGEQIVEDYQRFIFPGVQTIYFENQIDNFDIYWNKVCVETSDSYLPDSSR